MSPVTGINPKNTESKNIHTEQAAIAYLGIYVHIQNHICIQQRLMRKEAVNLKDSKKGNVGECGGREGKGKMVELHYNHRR